MFSGAHDMMAEGHGRNEISGATRKNQRTWGTGESENREIQENQENRENREIREQ